MFPPFQRKALAQCGCAVPLGVDAAMGDAEGLPRHSRRSM